MPVAVVAALDVILTDTATVAGRERPRHAFMLYACARDEEGARERLYGSLIEVIAPALTFTAEPQRGEFASWALIYYQRPGYALGDVAPSRMSWAARVQDTDGTSLPFLKRDLARNRLRVAERLVRECRIAGALPYRLVPPSFRPDILPPHPILMPESVPGDPLGVLVLGERSQVEGVGL
jgi:hypothetical protein